MFPSGVIYQKGKNGRRGTVELHPPFLVYLAYRTFQGLGAGLISFAVIMLLFTFGPVVSEEIKYQVSTPLPIQAEVKNDIKEEAAKYGLNSYFSLVIPKIDARSEIIANVNAENKVEYLSALEKGVAHAQGTHFPGMGESIFLFAHSTDSPLNFARYNAVFYLLGKLEEGDQVIVYFTDKKYVYEVTDKVITDKEDVSWFVDKNQGEILILQTCYPPGTTLQRLLVIAKPVDNN